MLSNSIEHHQVRLFAHQRDDVFLDQRIAHHHDAVAITVDQELRALDRLAAVVEQAVSERHHHVPAAGTQRGVDRLENGRVIRALEDRDVDADGLRRARQQRARGMRRAEMQLLDGPAHALGRGRRHRTLAADHARGRAEAHPCQTRDILDRGHGPN
jgi:hypothetical protein